MQGFPFRPSDFATAHHSMNHFHSLHYSYSHLLTYHHRLIFSLIPMILNFTLFYQILCCHFLSLNQIETPNQELHGSLSIVLRYFLFYLVGIPALFLFGLAQLLVLFSDFSFSDSDSLLMQANILLYLNFNNFSQTFFIKFNFFRPLLSQNFLFSQVI